MHLFREDMEVEHFLRTDNCLFIVQVEACVLSDFLHDFSLLPFLRLISLTLPPSLSVLSSPKNDDDGAPTHRSAFLSRH